MARIEVSPLESASGAAADVFARIQRAAGTVPNCFAAVGSLKPAVLKAILQVDGVLAASSLARRDVETVKLVVSEAAACDYCIAAHSLLGTLAGLETQTVKQIRAGQVTGDARRDALLGFVRTLVQTRGTITDEQFGAIKAAGYTDAELVDISLAIAVTTFTNVFNRINDTPLDFPLIA